jgi:hypothetical protein
VRPIYMDMPRLPQILDRLDGLGFRLSGVFPVTHERDQLGLVEVDCLFAKSRRFATKDRPEGAAGFGLSG